MNNELSKREKEVYDLFITGASTRDVAKCLSLSRKTVQTHRNNIFNKKCVNSIQELLSNEIKALKEENQQLKRGLIDVRE